MGKRNKKNRSMINVFSDGEEENLPTESNPTESDPIESDPIEEKKIHYNPFQLLDSASDKEEEFTQVKKKHKPPKVEPTVTSIKTEPKVEPKVEPIKTEPKVEPIKTEPKVEPIKTEPKVEPIKTESNVTPIKTEPKVEPKVEPIKTEPKKILKNCIYNKAIQSVKFKNYDLGIKFYIQSIETEKNPKAAYNLGILYEDLDDDTSAEKYYKIAYEMGHQNACYNLAILLMENKKYEEAVKYFKISIRNGEFDIIDSFIECLCLMNKTEEAFELLEKYTKYLNMNEEIKKLFAKSVRLPFN